MAENSKVITGLPNLPGEYIDPKLWGEFLTIYRAINNLLIGVSLYTGIDGPDAVEIASMPPTRYLLGQNVTRYYPIMQQNVVRGQVINLYNTGGTYADGRLASANSNLLRAHGITNTNASIGQRAEVLLFQGLTTALGGMTPGTNYYLSPTAGAIQNLPPVGAGQIVQALGVSLSSGEFQMNIDGSYIQL